ncbi:Uncharacterised protein [Streptococcus pneumoniae]|nr:Uncharacterised protein [Streptococcus pneumoniae]
MFTKPAPTPPYTVFNIIFTSGTNPPIGVNVSCIVFTAPVSAAVVTVAYSEENTVPNLTSFPSVLPCTCSIPIPFKAGFPFNSDVVIVINPSKNTMNSETKRMRPCFLFPTIRPYVNGSAVGNNIISIICKILLICPGFSKGCVELAPKNPPPLFPSSLMDTNDATGPRKILCFAPSIVCAVTAPSNVCGTPSATKTSAAINAIGRNTLVNALVKSTKKLPSSFPASPLINAITSANVVAGAANIKNVIPINCDK